MFQLNSGRRNARRDFVNMRTEIQWRCALTTEFLDDEDEQELFQSSRLKEGKFGFRRPIGGKKFTGDDKLRAKKFMQQQHKAAKEYHERRREKLRDEFGQQKPKKELPKKIQKAKDNFNARYLKWRRGIVAWWRQSEWRGRCMFQGCPNVPGIDHFVQVDHILDRDRFRQWRMEEWNVVVSCGCHSELDRDIKGCKPAPEKILQIVAQQLPYRFDIISEKLKESGRL